jgi:hypothetical protein
VHSSVTPAGSSSRSTRIVDTNVDRMSSVVAPSRSSRFCTAIRKVLTTCNVAFDSYSAPIVPVLVVGFPNSRAAIACLGMVIRVLQTQT